MVQHENVESKCTQNEQNFVWIQCGTYQIFETTQNIRKMIGNDLFIQLLPRKDKVYVLKSFAVYVK